MLYGYYFTNITGSMLYSKDSEVGIFEKISAVQRAIPSRIKSSADIHEEYGLSRSFCRGSNSEALNRGVFELDIDHNNRWRK